MSDSEYDEPLPIHCKVAQSPQRHDDRLGVNLRLKGHETWLSRQDIVRLSGELLQALKELDRKVDS